MKNKKIQRGMLASASFLSLGAALLLSATACDNKDYSKDSPFANAVYIDVAKVKDMATFSFNNTKETGKQSLSAELAYPAEQDVNVFFEADPSQVARYNARLGTDYPMLDAKYYKFDKQNVVIPKGETNSKADTLRFSGLKDLTIDASYLLPVTISRTSGGIGTLDGSKTICYVVKRSSAITVAASLTDNYFSVPGFFSTPTSSFVNGLKQLTYEAIIRIDKFDLNESISTIMGVEQHCLLRLGDSYFPRQQLQFASPGDKKFPLADNSKSLQQGEWYHVAVTYDVDAKTASIYVDGQLQSTIEDFGNGSPVNLGVGDAVKWENVFLIGQSLGTRIQLIRLLNGEICEVRVWNVVRTQEEIYKNMYSVDPATPGLCAYWKFNEGKGNIAHDSTVNGNDAVSYTDVVWPTGIEVPQKNKK